MTGRPTGMTTSSDGTSEPTVGVLSLHRSEETKAILDAVDDLGYGTEWLRAETLAVEIENGESHLGPAVDVVVSRLLLSKEEQPAELLGLASTVERLVPTLNRAGSTLRAMHKSDTGATRTSIDARLAADVGTGPIKDIVKIKSGSVKTGRSRPVVDVVVGIGGTQHTVSASIEDRSHMDYSLLLERDILEHYRVDVRRRVDEDREPNTEEEELSEE